MGLLINDSSVPDPDRFAELIWSYNFPKVGYETELFDVEFLIVSYITADSPEMIGLFAELVYPEIVCCLEADAFYIDLSLGFGRLRFWWETWLTAKLECMALLFLLLLLYIAASSKLLGDRSW